MNSEKHWTLAKRIDRVRKEMERRNIDTFLISKTENKNFLCLCFIPALSISSSHRTETIC